MRYSKQREQILAILRSTKCHPDAEWIYFKVKEIMPKISLGTVYRNLKELVDSGIIDSVETEQKVIRYDADTSPHAHFICEKCGEVKDIFGDIKVNSAFLDRSKILRQKVIFTEYAEIAYTIAIKKFKTYRSFCDNSGDRSRFSSKK